VFTPQTVGTYSNLCTREVDRVAILKTPSIPRLHNALCPGYGVMIIRSALKACACSAWCLLHTSSTHTIQVLEYKNILKQHNTQYEKMVNKSPHLSIPDIVHVYARSIARQIGLVIDFLCCKGLTSLQKTSSFLRECYTRNRKE
jgi:hypothetical protein